MALKGYLCKIIYTIYTNWYSQQNTIIIMEMEFPKQINNISERVVDDLKARLSASSRICVAAASFSISAHATR